MITRYNTPRDHYCTYLGTVLPGHGHRPAALALADGRGASVATLEALPAALLRARPARRRSPLTHQPFTGSVAASQSVPVDRAVQVHLRILGWSQAQGRAKSKRSSWALMQDGHST
jgi:hypothetical protein